jgi:carboxylate-amine ligase
MLNIANLGIYSLTMEQLWEWKPSKPLTVGVEWEFQILDREDLQLKDIFSEIYEELPDEILPFVHKEVYQSMLEFVTPIMEDENGAIEFFKQIFELIKPLSIKRKFHLVGLGTLFIKTEKPTRINYSERYKRLTEEFQELLRDFYIYGIHIHIGFPNKEWALRAFNNLVRYAPLLLALSANSIFYRGKDTGIHSYRMVVFEKLPRAELPRQFKTYRELTEILNSLKTNGVIETLKDLWWHIRPRPDFGTVEVRVFDSLWDLNRLKTILRLIRSIALYSEKYQDEYLPPEILKQNWWWAKRYSTDADFIDENGRKPLKQVAFDLIYKMQHLGILKELGYKVEEFTTLLRKPSLAKELSLKAKALGSLKKVIKLTAIV